MLVNLKELIEKSRPLISDKVRVGLSYIKVPNTLQGDEVVIKTDSKGNETAWTVFQSAEREILGKSKDEKYIYIKVRKKDFPNSLPKSVNYFVFPEGSELEQVYGLRATEIKILLLSDKIEELIPHDNMKFAGGQLVCKGNGQEASRFNPITKEWNPVPCPCAHHVDFDEEIIDFIDLNDDNPEVREVPIFRNGQQTGKKTQYLMQGAWRDYDHREPESDIIRLKPLTPDCNTRFTFRFTCPEINGLNIYTFDGSGRTNLVNIIRCVMDVQAVFRSVKGIPLFLRVRMEEKNIAGKGVRKFPRLYLHLPYSIDKLIESGMREKLLLDKPDVPPAQDDSHILPEGQEHSDFDETEYEVS